MIFCGLLALLAGCATPSEPVPAEWTDTNQVPQVPSRPAFQPIPPVAQTNLSAVIPTNLPPVLKTNVPPSVVVTPPPATNGVKPHVASGRLRVLAITAGKRTPTAPEYPTVAETVPGYEVDLPLRR